MIWLLLLACSDKDGSDDTGGATDDTGGATDDTGDVVDDFSCTLSALSPFTVPIDESTDLTATLTCTVDAELTKVTLDGDEVEFGQSGTALTMKTLPKQSGRYTYTFWIKPLGKDAPPVSVDGEFRAHTAPVFDGPTNLTHLTDEGELLAMTASATLTRSEDSIIELTDDGQEVGRFKHTWLLDGDASCATQMPIAVCGTLGTDAVGWVNVESQKTQWVEVDGTVDAFAPGELGPVIAYTKPAQADNQSSGTQVRTHDGKTYDVGLLEGLLELKEAELLHGECDKDGFFQLTEISYVGAKVKSINSVGVQCPTTGAWQMMSLDLDDDGDLDELHTFDQGDTVDLVARIQENEESWSVHTAVLQGSNPQFNADSSITITSGSLLFKDQATFGADSTITVNRTWIGTSPGASYIRSGRGSAVTDDNGNTWFVEHAQPWVLDLGNGGEELTRTNDAAGIAFAVDGAEVKAYVDTPLTGFYDNHVVSITAEDMVIDEREMTTGADWDYVAPVGGTVGGQLWLARGNAEKGVGLTLLDLDDLDGTEEALQGMPIFVAKLHYDTTSEDLEDAFTAWGVAPPPGGSAPAAPSLVAHIDTDNGCALAILHGTTTAALDDIEIIEEAESCDALPAPIASGDYFDDGGTQVVLTNGRLLGIDSVGCILVFGPPDELYRSAPGGGDINGDGLPDVVVAEGAERTLLLNNGDGTFTAYEGDLPSWIWMSATPGFHLNRPSSAIFPTSWSVMLD